MGVRVGVEGFGVSGDVSGGHCGRVEVRIGLEGLRVKVSVEGWRVSSVEGLGCEQLSTSPARNIV